MQRALAAPVAALMLLLAACNAADTDPSADAAPASSDATFAASEALPQDTAKPETAPTVAPVPAPAPPPATAAAKPKPRPATSSRSEPTRIASAAPPKCSDCGTVSSIETVNEKGQGSGMGAVAGAVLGGVIGHQFGKGKGKDAATAGGAIAGGVIGHQAERQIRATQFYRVNVVMEEGGYTRTVELNDVGNLTVGSKVRVDGQNLILRN